MLWEKNPSFDVSLEFDFLIKNDYFHQNEWWTAITVHHHLLYIWNTSQLRCSLCFIWLWLMCVLLISFSSKIRRHSFLINDRFIFQQYYVLEIIALILRWKKAQLQLQRNRSVEVCQFSYDSLLIWFLILTSKSIANSLKEKSTNEFGIGKSFSFYRLAHGVHTHNTSVHAQSSLGRLLFSDRTICSSQIDDDASCIMYSIHDTYCL